jgi:hypothetical protein
MTARHGFYVLWIDPTGAEHLTCQPARTIAELFRVADDAAAVAETVCVSAGWYPAPAPFERRNSLPWPPGTYRR